MKKPLHFLLVKPAGPDCNMRCEYCFYLEKSDLFSGTRVHRMSETVLEEMIKQAMLQSQSDISFGWQGGEPTLMGLPFFEKAVYYQQKYGMGKTVGNGLQTNGLLLDAAWAKFLAEYQFLVGLSLDGPQHIHDHYRLMTSGRGSWEKVVEKGRMLLDLGVEVNALSVVNQYSVQYPDEIYEFHKSFGLNYMQFIPCVETDPDRHGHAASFSVPAEAYGDFLIKLFDLWQADFENGHPTTSIRFFDSVFYSYVGMTPPECTLQQTCGNYLVVEHNGDVFSCDFFVTPEWKLGNVMQNQLSDMINSEKQWEFGQLKSSIHSDCKNCQWLRSCWGGCIKDRLRDPGDQQLNHFCQSLKMFYEYADQPFKQLALQWQQQQQHMTQENQLTENGTGVEVQDKIGRNDPCPCGSGKKYKKCCARQKIT